MKFQHHEHGDAVDVKVSGQLEVSSCRCLENFWAMRVAGHRRITVDLSDVIDEEPEAVALLARLLSEAINGGVDLSVEGLPATVAEELAKQSD